MDRIKQLYEIREIYKEKVIRKEKALASFSEWLTDDELLAQYEILEEYRQSLDNIEFEILTILNNNLDKKEVIDNATKCRYEYANLENQQTGTESGMG